MEYSSYSTKVVYGVIGITLCLMGSALASWDKNIDQEVIVDNAIEQIESTDQGGEDPIIEDSQVDSGVIESTSTIVYLNDWQYVDIEQVRSTWLQWTNYLRTQQLGGRTAYDPDRRLNMTAQYWSDYSARIGSITHKRSKSDGYYNYNGLVSWFKNKGRELTGQPLMFVNTNRATFSESIGWGMWNCREADCTDEIIDATRGTWNFFYGERKSNGVHYRALVQPSFGLQGLGIAFSGKKYYLTIHYGTAIIE